MKNLYLDIDGVILTKDGKPAKNLLDFLKFFTSKFNCYWLTTHCKGDAKTAVDYLASRLPEEEMSYIKKIKPTNWNTFKTEAIDFKKQFNWFDDYIMDAERKALLEENSMYRFHEIDLLNEPGQLTTMISLDYKDSFWCWQEMDLKISFSEEEFELIKKGFVSDQGMDERWQFEFQKDTLYIMRHWTRWVNYKLKFDFLNGKYTSTEVYISNLVSQKKTGKTNAFENNFHGIFIIFLIEHYLLGNNRNFLFDSQMIYAKSEIPIDSIHGYDHWKNVERVGHYIADKNGADKKVISSFAFLHDISRITEAEEPDHGRRSAEIIKKSFFANTLKLNQEQYTMLLEAVSEHNNSKAKSGDITVQTCWDADRLDLPRVREFPDKKLLHTKVGKSDETFTYLGLTKK